MHELFSVKTVVSLFSAVVITGTILATFCQATSSVPTQWSISINGIAPPAQRPA